MLKHGFRASGVRTEATGEDAETSLLPRFLRSVLKRPSQEVRRELASGERFSAVAAAGQSTGLPRKPQETCHSARRLVRRRARLVWELADRVGFEPTIRSRVYALSRRAPSTARPPVLRGEAVHTASPPLSQYRPVTLRQRSARRPVSRVLSSGYGSPHDRLDDHSSGTGLTARLSRPTRVAGRKTPAAHASAAASTPIRPCSRWGLPCRRHCWKRGALLPHRFTLAGGEPLAVCFLWHCP